MAVIATKCPKCGGMMDINSDGFNGFTANCIICGKSRNIITSSLPASIRQKVRDYSVISCQSPDTGHIQSSIIRYASNRIGVIYTRGRNYGERGA